VPLSQGDVCLSCPGFVDLGVLLPHLAGVTVEAVTTAAGLLLVSASARSRGGLPGVRDRAGPDPQPLFQDTGRRRGPAYLPGSYRGRLIDFAIAGSRERPQRAR